MKARAVLAIFILLPAAASAERSLAQDLFKRLRQLHRGSGPCLRYDDGPVPGDDAARLMARKLLDAGVDVETLQRVLPYFTGLGDESEQKAHQRPEREELKTAMLEAMSPAEKETVTRTPAQLERQLDQTLALKYVPVQSQVEARSVFNALSKPAGAALMELWREHPEVTQVWTFVTLRDVMRVEEGVYRLRRAGQFALDVYTKTGRWPEELPPNLSVIDSEEVHYFQGASRVVLGSPAVAFASWIEVVKEGLRPYKPGPCRDVRKSSMNQAEFQEWIDGAGPGSKIVRAVDEKTRTASGFRLFAFEPGNLLERVGFCEGDIVMRAGSFDLTRPGQTQAAYKALLDASTLVFSVLRGGREIELEIQQRK